MYVLPSVFLGEGKPGRAPHLEQKMLIFAVVPNSGDDHLSKGSFILVSRAYILQRAELGGLGGHLVILMKCQVAEKVGKIFLSSTEALYVPSHCSMQFD